MLAKDGSKLLDRPRLEVRRRRGGGSGAVDQTETTRAAGVPGIVPYEVPDVAAGNSVGGDEQVDGRVVQAPTARLRAEYIEPAKIARARST
jgi:hypothetical protein